MARVPFDDTNCGWHNVKKKSKEFFPICSYKVHVRQVVL